MPVTLFMALMTGALSGTVGPSLRYVYQLVLLSDVLSQASAACACSAMILNTNEPYARGSALALQAMSDDLGRAAAPLFLSLWIQRFGRQTAFNLATSGWIVCGVLLAATSLTLAKDEDAMQKRLQACSAQADTQM